MDQQSESTHLLVNTASEGSPSPLQQKSVCISCPLSKHLCLPSKAAILILLWTIIVGTVYHNLVGDAAGLVVSSARLNTYFSMYVSVPYAILAIVMMFYPLSGFIADVYCGRLKTVVVSLIFLLSCNVMLILASLVGVTVKHTPVSLVYKSQDFSEEKISGLGWESNPHLHISGVLLYQLSYQARWEQGGGE